MPRLTNQVWEQIIKEVYLSNNIKRTAKRYGITGAAIKYQLDKRNLPSVSGGHRQLKLNESAFSKLDEKSAYWLGFIMADGCVSRTTKLYNKPNRLSIQISASDISHLKKFREFIRTDKDIEVYTPKGTYASYDMCRLIINSTKLCSDLFALGVCERKTGKEMLPMNLPDNLVRHFIRGFFDGDGSVSRSSNGYCTFSICGNHRLLSYLQVYLVSECGLNFTSLTKDKRHDDVYRLFYAGKQVQRVYDYLYSGATVWLDRKREKFDLLLS